MNSHARNYEFSVYELCILTNMRELLLLYLVHLQPIIYKLIVVKYLVYVKLLDGMKLKSKLVR